MVIASETLRWNISVQLKNSTISGPCLQNGRCHYSRRTTSFNLL